MPTYEFRCKACGHEFEKLMPMSQCEEVQSCPHCGEAPALKLISGGSGFILKGDGWTGKNIKVSRQMAEKNRVLGRKQETKKKEQGISLVPNVHGERTGSWSDASKLAASQGKDTSGYEKMAAKEKK